mmetsp:Transcript_31274/g.90339  ORF Transcript_31274/g.90339 Transcript_31274/m.90339 type:complete len:208 (+) Transcript_31274:260-883(+)
MYSANSSISSSSNKRPPATRNSVVAGRFPEKARSRPQAVPAALPMYQPRSRATVSPTEAATKPACCSPCSRAKSMMNWGTSSTSQVSNLGLVYRVRRPLRKPPLKRLKKPRPTPLARGRPMSGTQLEGSSSKTLGAFWSRAVGSLPEFSSTNLLAALLLATASWSMKLIISQRTPDPLMRCNTMRIFARSCFTKEPKKASTHSNLKL